MFFVYSMHAVLLTTSEFHIYLECDLRGIEWSQTWQLCNGYFNYVSFSTPTRFIIWACYIYIYIYVYIKIYIYLFKLSQYGISDALLRWFNSYLSDRSQQSIVDVATSTGVPVTSGVTTRSVAKPYAR